MKNLSYFNFTSAILLATIAFILSRGESAAPFYLIVAVYYFLMFLLFKNISRIKIYFILGALVFSFFPILFAISDPEAFFFLFLGGLAIIPVLINIPFLGIVLLRKLGKHDGQKF